MALLEMASGLSILVMFVSAARRFSYCRMMSRVPSGRKQPGRDGRAPMDRAFAPLTQVIPGYHLQHLFPRFALTIRRMYLHDLMAEK
jgi:hypothetical protein